MFKTARNLSILGVGLGVSAAVGWLLFKEARRDRRGEPATVRIRSQSRAAQPDMASEIVLPMESLDADPGEIDESTPILAQQPDDLTQIHDVGPRFAEALSEIGITTYAQLAAQDPDALAERLSERVVVRAQRIRDRDWIGQAARLARGEHS